MQHSIRRIVKSNPPMRLVTEKPSAPIKLSGLEAAAEMEPGEYSAACVNAFLQRSKNQAVLEFRIIEGPHAGTSLAMWINGVGAAIRPTSRYAKECAATLGRDLTADDNLDPAAVFGGKNFTITVGWRLTDKPGGGKAGDEYGQRKKDGRDFLRVHRITGEVSL